MSLRLKGIIVLHIILRVNLHFQSKLRDLDGCDDYHGQKTDLMFYNFSVIENIFKDLFNKTFCQKYDMEM